MDNFATRSTCTPKSPPLLTHSTPTNAPDDSQPTYSYELDPINEELESGQISSGLSAYFQLKCNTNSTSLNNKHCSIDFVDSKSINEDQNQRLQNWGSSRPIKTRVKSCKGIEFNNLSRRYKEIGTGEPIQYEINSHDHRQERFSFRVWVRHRVLKKMTDFLLFQLIQAATNVSYIYLDLKHPIPDVEGAAIQIYDKQESRLQDACLMLVRQVHQVQKVVYFDEHNADLEVASVVILVPSMLVPVLMGKEGKLIRIVKDLSKTNIEVHGPYSSCNYQPVQVSSVSLESAVKCCCAIYSIVYKALKCQSIHIQHQVKNYAQIRRFGIILSWKEEQIIFGHYSKFMGKLEEALNIRKESHAIDKHQICYMIFGKLEELKEYVAIFLQLLGFENDLDSKSQFVVTFTQAKLLTSFNGKFLRDISSKCHDCFFRVKDKEPIFGNYKLAVKGSQKAKIKAADMILELLAYAQPTSQRQKEYPPINYQFEIQSKLPRLQLPQQLQQQQQRPNFKLPKFPRLNKTYFITKNKPCRSRYSNNLNKHGHNYENKFEEESKTKGRILRENFKRNSLIKKPNGICY